MRRWSRIVSFVALLGLLASALPTTSGAQVRPATATIAVKIAVAGPLTAGAVALGQGMQRGTELAIQDNTARLASAGVSVSVLSEDDQGDPKTAVDVANAIVADSQVMGVVGHLNSGCSIPASKVYAMNHLAMVSPVSSNPALTQQGLNNVFRTCATDAGQGSFAADTIAKHLRLLKAYVVNDFTPYGMSLSSGFAKRYKSDGGTVVHVSSTSDAQTNFSALVKLIKAKNPDVVYYGGIYNAGALLAKQLKASGVKAMFVGGDGLFDPAFVTIAGKSVAEGDLATNVGLPLSEMPGGVKYSAESAAKFPHQGPLLTDAYAYDAATAIINGIIQVANESSPTALLSPSAREAVRAKVAASNFAGVTGNVAFNSAGDTKFPAFSAWRVKFATWKVCAQVSKPSMPASVKKNVAFTVTGTLNPRHFAGSKAVMLRFWRKVGGTWALGTTVLATVSDFGPISKYSASVRLSPAGTWRVIANHSDGSHPSMDSVVFGFTVK